MDNAIRTILLILSSIFIILAAGAVYLWKKMVGFVKRKHRKETKIKIGFRTYFDKDSGFYISVSAIKDEIVYFSVDNPQTSHIELTAPVNSFLLTFTRA